MYSGSLKNKNILIGVCGGIAIYKVCNLIRILKKEEANVKVVLTTGAEKFVSPLLFSSLSENKAYTNEDFFKADGSILHIELGRYPDLILILPATASFISKLATGSTSELLLAILLSTKAPVYIFPSMNTSMWEHPATQENIKKLRNYGYFVYEPAEGILACGEIGRGRLPEVEEIFEVVKAHFVEKNLLGKRILITGGPTREYIDEVRFITNASSGKTAFFLAKEAYYRGAEVHLIWGLDTFPYVLPKLNYFSDIPFPKLYFVKTTQEMFEVAKDLFPLCEISIFAGAPCDFKPKMPFKGKLKKKEGFTIELELTIDIAKTLNSYKSEKQITIGFALEEEKELVNYGKKEKKEKFFDFLVANPLETVGKDESDYIIFTPKESLEFKNLPKSQLAKVLFDLIGS
ncbi:MAG: bifunctional phosphopantothenoylcysteine decarboxylase/phosphopantothenate--cysteine ligase CoaBC [Thermodesulfobacterium geofontis]|uniref:Coenzyme A biosynthesis bifunctional protein CoaBC n=3 Tax=Thermodesulfobacterium geofontis TaxID=1295609 RepID=A0A2N7PM00_9BACT|nr:MAG: bifunctional phosphopantothenoylcysteine decarboxylase/phosphopantothenate--cysteine ligase CoaBC [Thermodesulfobacterium geofontis]